MTRADHDDRTPVVIAGAGPAGLAAASELAHHGIRTVVVEPRRHVSHLRPRAKTTSARTMELFRRWGVADTVRAAAPLSPHWSRRVVFCETLAGEAITEFRDVFGLSAAEHGLAAEAGQQVAQPVVEEVLREHLERSGLAELRLGERLRGFTAQPDGVTCEVVRADGSIYRLDAEYLLGCDGGRSAVRNGIGATLRGGSAPAANLNAVIRAPGLRPAAGTALHYWVVGTDVPGVVGPLDRAGTWWVSLGGVGGSADTERAVGLIAELAGRPVAELGVDVLSTDPWTPRMMLADRWATERVFLVGESAHVNPPLGGHGFNTCVGDAVNIGWKLAAVLRGWAGPGLLASYEVERRGVAERTLASAVRNLRASGPDRATTADRIQETKAEEFHSLGLVLGYSYAGSPVVAGEGDPPPPGGGSSVQSYAPTTRPGARLPHAWVGPGHALYDDLGRGMTLLRPPDSDAAAVDAFAGRAAELGVPLTLIDLPIGTDRAPDHLLVRPDQHIAWRGRDLATVDLSRLCGIPQPQRLAHG
ncbi:FAD-dependent monooxygenase [Pseudonocardia humida]|uniref:FAD-dependent monooxygenase n=1 Tax=Pseudonocardia humida TaxID=2800819 RepID=A0ABT1ACR1_9PSEU|nr:FAD-dependent monooxygenase [Pseudonocardia humida]MCO1660708.1 FAD-dependent monooxygenase [Pseudonocardia humida]